MVWREQLCTGSKHVFLSSHLQTPVGEARAMPQQLNSRCLISQTHHVVKEESTLKTILTPPPRGNMVLEVFLKLAR